MNGSADYKLTVFTEALQLPAHEGAAYLERACGGDLELRRAVVWSEKSLKSDQALAQARGYAVLAMAQWQLGQKEKARAMLAGGDSLAPRISSAPDTVDLGDSWVAWLCARILLDEAGQLIQPDAVIEANKAGNNGLKKAVAARNSI